MTGAGSAARRLLAAGAALAAALAASFAALSPAAGEDAEALAVRATGILETHCIDCHGKKQKVVGYDVAKRETVVGAESDSGGFRIVAGKPDDSLLWQRIAEGTMPPGKRPKLNDEEKATLRAWIEAGAPYPQAAPASGSSSPPASGPGAGAATSDAPRPSVPLDLPGDAGPGSPSGGLPSLPDGASTTTVPPAVPPGLPPARATPPPSGGTPSAPPSGGDVAARGTAVLQQFCFQCHGAQFKVPRFDVSRRETFVGVPSSSGEPIVVPGRPDASLLYQRVHAGEMPPRAKPERPTAEHIATLKEWIEAGAPFPAGGGEAARPRRSMRWLLETVRDDLRRTDHDVRAYRRYFTVVNLWNQPRIASDELAATRAAFAKVLNGLTWESRIVVPRAVDPDGIVLCVDLRDLGWHRRGVWGTILEAYPYGLVHETSPEDPALNEVAREVSASSGTRVAVVRADWFAVTASRPPLYHDVLDVPTRVADLEARLGVRPEEDFLVDRLRRAAFTRSGVSRQNRVIDRHPSRYGAYWKSYDFRTEDGRGNVVRFPLGPAFPENPFPDQAFLHAGGEIIFSLPNGMQGYMLADAEGNRIDIGPADIVFDSSNTGRSPEIVNGISCMVCHKAGMQMADDVVRAGSAALGEARFKVSRIYAPVEEMRRLYEEDKDRFLRAQRQALSPFTRDAATLDGASEPLSRAIERYVQDVDAEAVAAELFLDDARDLPALVRASRALRDLGLGTLVQGGSMPRAVWESRDRVTSPMQRAARELDLGQPYVKF